MAGRGETGETCLGLFPMTTANRVQSSEERKVFEAEPIAILRSSLELQKQLIAKFYAE
jgi:hypothetical protein